MPLPEPEQVEEARARLWTPAQIQHAYLLLEGISAAIRTAPAPLAPKRDQLDRKAVEIEIESAELLRILQRRPEDISGAELSVRVCSLLACDSDPTFSEALGVPLAVVLAGRQRMLALASDLVAKGLAGA